MTQKLTCTPDHAHRFIRIDAPKHWGEDGPEGSIRFALTATRCTLAALQHVIDRASAPRDGRSSGGPYSERSGPDREVDRQQSATVA